VEITEAEFDLSFGVNAKGAFFVMQEAARRIADHGRIINMGTTILGATIPYYSVYAGSKAPLEDFTRALAKEVGHRGVTVNVVAPGPIDTDFYRGAETPESVARTTTASVAGRLGRIEDIVPVIEFLASPRSQWVTAQTLFVNGGYLAR
jgi:NAD(P)-dependent dehydrogenase (short-subunit alcohol dehydrogenase family)